VTVAMWEAMERNDFSRWPTGVHARSFVREYALAIGVDPADTIDDFCRGFPEQGDRRRDRLVRDTAEIIGHDFAAEDHLPPGVTHDRRASPRPVTPPTPVMTKRIRLIAAALDGVLLLIVSRLVVSIVPIGMWTTFGVLALVYNAASLIVIGSTPAAWVVGTYLVAHPEIMRGQFPLFRRLDASRKKEPSFERPAQ